MKKNIKIWILICCLAFLVVAVITKGFGLFEEKRNVITIPLFEISENAKWYEHNGNNFFVVKADDGTIKTALDTCDVCYAAGKGYRQEGDDMVCNNCELRFAISGLGTENKNPDGCWPGYLPSAIEGGNLIIKESALLWRNDASGAEAVCDLKSGVCPVL